MIRKRIYVAGPLASSGVREQNVRNAVRVGMELARRGYAPLIPHLTHFIDKKDRLGWDAWLEVCLAWVAVSDALLRLPGVSKGADMEVAEAKLKGIPVFHSIDELQWAEK